MKTKTERDHSPLYKEVGRRIYRARRARKVTQSVLAARVSLTRTSVTNIEKGRQKLLLHTFLDIAAALQVSPQSLLPPTNETPQQTIDALLKDRPQDEAAWVKSVIGSEQTPYESDETEE